MDSNAVKKQINKTPFERIIERTKQARENIAEQLLERGELLNKISERAGLGYNFYIIEPSEPIDITETNAAIALISTFNSEGFNVTKTTREYNFYPKFKDLKKYISNHHHEKIKVRLLRIEWDI